MAVMEKEAPIPTPEQVKAVREKLGLTQAEAAERVGVSQEAWSAWERGVRKPTRRSAMLIDMLRRKKI